MKTAEALSVKLSTDGVKRIQAVSKPSSLLTLLPPIISQYDYGVGAQSISASTLGKPQLIWW